MAPPTHAAHVDDHQRKLDGRRLFSFHPRPPAGECHRYALSLCSRTVTLDDRGLCAEKRKRAYSDP